ncbi:Two component system, signal transduction histidine kinase [Acididesulfobacillus acetoxydans]|uniref:histidine kinase n=1 Tax=Acididesulfobacillus acetoxydans TaxID=1561005 RepID=A0A8S0WX05_9FIRM|nr:HAMP domain-containing sensor histidine kinase [Acididesulfobacillus acetoxydans]CAA7600641.1 Two component system, signal transduction histidine kinase [Acididesulfobacillus acetoxydans]CEJ09422.1 Signal transduction histidine-protein kinase BaeS [Acididesulfobacillus acetoxydans]
MRKKLFLSTLAIVLLTLALSILAVELVFRQQFSNYLTQTAEATLNELPGRLEAAYQGNGHWDKTQLTNLGQLLPLGGELTLLDPRDRLIETIANPMNTMMSDTSQGMMGMGMGMGGYSAPTWKTKTFNLADAHGPIGTAVIRYPSASPALNPRDRSFTSAVFRSLLLAGGLALLLGVLLSYWMSRKVSSPLLRLTQAAYRIGQGHLEERVSFATDDEIGRLATAFNAMADNLKGQERLRKQMTADIAHELRTPLTSMRSFVEAFQDGVLPPDAENLAALNEEIDRLVDLASDLKDLNVAEIGALTINSEPVALDAILSKVVRNLSPLLQEKEITVTWEPPEPGHEVTLNGDSRLLTRLFYNLIQNAYKYSEAGGSIAIRLQKSPDFVQVQIRDCGIGIPDADLPNIFERFYRADKSRSRETGGTGIGLALVKQIATLHQGSVAAESKLGQGSTFTVRLPLERQGTKKQRLPLPQSDPDPKDSRPAL